MRTMILKNKSQLRKIIKEKEREILELKKRLKLDVYRAEHRELIANYSKGKFLTPDLMVIDTYVKLEIPELHDTGPTNFLSFLFGVFKRYWSNRNEIGEPFLKIKCLDLKHNKEVTLDIEEAKSLEELKENIPPLQGG